MEAASLSPCGQRLLIQAAAVDPRNTAVGAILLPEQSAALHARHLQAEVIAIGYGVLEPALLPGVRIVTERWRKAGLNDDDQVIIYEDSAKAILYYRGGNIQVRPLSNYVAIKQDEEEEHSGLIEIPDAAKKRPSTGEVIACGEGAFSADGERLPMEVSEGDRVLFSKYAGTVVEHNGEEVLLIREHEILAII